MEKIVLLNKKEGNTPLQEIGRYRNAFPEYDKEKISVAGRLDPMASGLLILLIGDSNKKRNTFENLEKTYEFELLLGIETDTYDVLGRIVKINEIPTSFLSMLPKILTEYQGKVLQPYPPYSSMTVSGKPLFYWAREGRLSEISIPTKEITISSLNLKNVTTLVTEEVLTAIVQRIKMVEGNFRQNEIISEWKKQKNSLPKKLPIITLTATVSSGTYIRAICNELGEIIGCGGLAYGIKRTRVGKYKLEDALIIP